MSSHELGTVKFFRPDRGFGFIQGDDRRAVFFRQEVVIGEVEEVAVGRRVLFVTIETSGPPGKEKGEGTERAIRVVLLSEENLNGLDACPTCGLAFETQQVFSTGTKAIKN